MTRPEPLYAALRRQATYALTAFVIAACALEVLMPGTVLPIMDIVPFALLASVLLVYDAARRPQPHGLGWIEAVGKLFCAGLLFATLFALIPWDGRAGLAATIVIAMGLISLAFWPKK